MVGRRKVTWSLWLCVSIAAVLQASCGAGGSKQPVGTIHARLAGGAQEVAAVRVDVARDGKVVSSQVVSLRADQPAGDGGTAPGADAFFTLGVGPYDVAATALDAQGAAAMGCARSSASAQVVARHTTEIALMILCDGRSTGGLDVVVTVHEGPVITGLTIGPSKFIDTCQGADMTVTATIADGSPLTYGWSVSGPAGASPTLTSAGNHAHFVTQTAGEYTVTVVATATSGQSASLDFPLHVGGSSVESCEAACSPTPEQCFNGKDDDCDGLVDCADTDCVPAAVCVPDPASSAFHVGVTVGAPSCPSPFGDPVTINSGLSGGGASCGGCSCGPGSTTCALDRRDYRGPDQHANCEADNGLMTTSFAPLLTLTSGSTTGNCFPAGGGLMGGFFSSTHYADHFQETFACGAPAGTPVLPPATWSATQTFCESPLQGGGCDAGQICVPRAPAPSAQCVLATGGVACPAGYVDQGPRFQGFADSRSCTACACGDPKGGSCADVHLNQQEGCASSFGALEVPLGFADCGAEFSYLLRGNPTPPMCTAASSVVGELSPTGGVTVCCL